MALFNLTSALFCLAQKVQNIHWVIEGPQFLEVHKMLGEQYEKLREFGDIFAENIRSMGGTQLPTIKDIAKVEIVGQFNKSSTLQMLADLLQNYDFLANYVNNVQVTERGVSNDLDDLHKYLTKQIYFLKSILN